MEIHDSVFQQASRARGLEAKPVAVRLLSDESIVGMFSLFQCYYDDVDESSFRQDLLDKDAVIVLESNGAICGFTTMRTFNVSHAGGEATVVFSGDTVVARQFWGEQVLAIAWLRQLSEIAQATPDAALYWLLIVKGHRTFRYMPTFARRYVPSVVGDDDRELIALRDVAAATLFREAFDPATGIVRFARPRGRLAATWAEPTPRERARDDVAFFLRRNPGYRDGDELACLCSLAPQNMRPFGRRVFERGLQ
jgi:hypothetical protein